ncbi:HET-domain-containing protein [Paraphaeosphaeria sporulosa]|uniref:HET-domain-containing protein n=1 Tax=Paraphaeosphaeria sporulosa TaxID=1460663 RepID=A0A177C7K2_9PLEO|nr:HET-domain-containing protein [Paraphaeosphaeria sporulosa]OAG02680.1 HET-domain-containing protein [Paraphaeosphaeria sporulosa]
MSHQPVEEARNAMAYDMKLLYRPLEMDEIRLVTIEAAQTTDRKETIRCSLRHYPFALPLSSEAVPRYDWGDYIALSYCWGWDARNPSCQINIDGHLCNVTESLEAALQTLRGAQTTTTIPVKFWVDALCINQSDSEEVKAEILRMRDIYGQAASVYVHLGAESEDSDLGFKFMYKTSKALSQSVESVVQELFNKRMSATDLEKKAYIAMLRLLNRPYWQRVWVLQEMAMSRGSLTVACGVSEMYLEDILPVSRFVSLNAESILILLGFAPEAVQLLGMSITLHCYTSMWATRGRKDRTLQRTALEPRAKYLDLRQPLLTLAQSAQATKPHDNVYGLLGIVPAPIRDEMSSYIDYNLPIATVFTAFSKAIITFTEDLDVIFAKSFAQTMAPSWATDWSLVIDRATFPHDWVFYNYDQFDGAYDDLQKVIESSSFYRADGGRKLKFSFIPSNSPDLLLLKCSGISIGEIDGLGLPLTTAPVPLTRTEPIQPNSTLNPYGDDQAVARALIHTLFGNPTWGDTVGAALFRIPWIAQRENPVDYFTSDGQLNLTKDDIERFTQLRARGWETALGNNFFMFEFWRRTMSQFRIGGKRFQDYFDTEVVDCSYPSVRIKLDVATVMGAHGSRCLITLDTGHFGLAPHHVERGDQVFVLQGSSLPLVLRPVGETGQFRVIGECFVDGYWNGEAFDGAERGGFEIEEVVLC